MCKLLLLNIVLALACPVGWNPADINNDCRVDLADFAIMAKNWLKEYEMSYPNKVQVSGTLTDAEGPATYDTPFILTRGYFSAHPERYGGTKMIRLGEVSQEEPFELSYPGSNFSLRGLIHDSIWNSAALEESAENIVGEYEPHSNATGTATVEEYVEKKADEMLLNKTRDMDGAVHEWTHPYVRYVDIARVRVRNKDGTWGPASGAGAVSWVNSAHDLELRDAAFAASEDSDLGVWLWNIPDNMPNKVLAIVYDAETAADTNPPVGFCYIFKNKRVVSGRGAPLSVFGEVVK